MAEYRLTPAAERDLEAIWSYTQQQWGIEQATHYFDAIVATFAELAHMPKSAQSCDHIRAGYRRRSIGRHMIYFRLTSYGIAITRILHDRMDATRHL
ncbi:MAG: type II toxin-antitoxin system RelE/ParE family toxin [Burkholderiales bacterium]|nr:type II toxin-antitoxin system RelE/ParE family toxin [Burkholderiales bacterium]